MWKLFFPAGHASVHIFQTSKSLLDVHFVKLLYWPVRNHYLNTMENLWSIQTQKVYRNGIQHENKQAFPISKMFDHFFNNVLKELSNFMASRLIKVTENKGDYY